ncbi:hypothetical protein [Streptomyces sp. NPDC058751]|uniref:hypothetical protein n=1 Tax=Streptomyces sp. NPDC058751 TaxID=3346623 RepID=UPI0036A84013
MPTEPATATPETVAAFLFVAAFNLTYATTPRVTIALNTSKGSRMAIVGELADGPAVRFNSVEVATMLTWLTRAEAHDPDAIVTVQRDTGERGTPGPVDEYAQGYAWHLGTGVALSEKEAAPLFGRHVELRGAELPHYTLRSDDMFAFSTDSLSCTALTDDVKAVVIAHGEPERPAAGHRFALRLDGTVTVHVDAADVPAALDALGEIEFEDFDVEFRTGGGHVIGHITLGEAEGAELVSVDGIPADELD